MKNTYTVVIGGQTVKRTTNHDYKFAVGLVNKTTGKVRNVKFTAGVPRTDWSGVKGIPWGSSNDRDRIRRQNAEIEKEWQVEVVPL